MHLHTLSIQNVRNLKTQSLTFNPSANFLYGMNGQGKTSLLEAIFVLASGKSFRTSRIQEIISTSSSVCQIDASIVTDVGESFLSFRRKDQRSQILHNGSPVSSARDFLKLLPAVCFSTNDVDLVFGGPAVRRRFFDRIRALQEPSFVDVLTQYYKVLKQRNAFLADLQKGKGKIAGQTESQLAIWDNILAEKAQAIATHRCKLVQEIGSLVQNFYGKIADQESVTLSYKSSVLDESKNLRTVEELRRRLEEQRTRDIRLARTMDGIHRDDIELYLRAEHISSSENAKSHASRGQARTLALALVLAAHTAAKRKSLHSPILLLDDFISELDARRQHDVFLVVNDLCCQVFITGTEFSDSLKGLINEREFFEVSDGMISPAL